MNAGNNAINPVTVNWSVNGVVQTPVVHSTQLNTIPSGLQYMDTVALGTVNLSNGNPATLKIWTSNPNNTGDVQNFNDTIEVVVTPTDFSISSNMDTICANNTLIMNLDPTTGIAPGSLAWQWSPNGTAWNTVANTDSTVHTVNTLTSDRYYRVRIQNELTTCYTDSLKIIFTDPQLLSWGDTSRCGPGPVTLSAVGGYGATVKWYNEPSGGQLLGTGNTHTTSFLTADSTYYVSAGLGSGSSTPKWIGNGTNMLSGYPNPFYTLYYGARIQYLITAAEMNAEGFTAGSILSLGLYVGNNSNFGLNNHYIRMKNTNATALTSWETGLTQVYSSTPSIPLTANSVNTFTFNTPFQWDGVSNIVIEMCYNNSGWGSTGATVRYTQTSFISSIYYRADNTSVCSSSSVTGTSSSRPNFEITMDASCESARQMVTAIVNPLPDPDLGPDVDTCIAVGTSVTLDPGPQANTPTYIWDNNSTGATRTVNASGTYHVEVTNQFDCAARDTINVNIKWNPEVDLAANGTNLCIGGTKVLDAGPDGQSGGNYYWNTGATTQTFTITAGGTYIAYVTSPEGCLTIDTVKIIENGYMPTVHAIVAQPQGQYTFQFMALNPQNVVLYVWDFGDGNTDTAVSPVHTYAQTGDYIVKLMAYSVCGDVLDSSTVHILTTSVRDLEDDKLVQIYPNPNNGSTLFIETKGDLIINDLVIYNNLGQEIKHVRQFDKVKKHAIELPLNLASGVYHLRILTNKGATNRKLDIIK